MKKRILTDLEAIGRPADEASLKQETEALLRDRFGSYPTYCGFSPDNNEWTVTFGRDVDPRSFEKITRPFDRRIRGREDYVVAPDEADPDDWYITLRACPNGYGRRRGQSCLFARPMPYGMKEDIENGLRSGYAILTISPKGGNHACAS